MLTLDKIFTRYGNIEAVKGISLTVNQGELVTIFGGNGAGKSTTMKTVVGLVKASSGRVLFEDRAITNRPAHEIISLGIALVPEGRMVFPGFTVQENLKAGAYCLKK
ncbi:MAG TPA: ATP-binding cassette domain-containing protein, partial [Desulfosporosinus sp.]|nr:ATP-binding cassette domain-containing protein [Desulfosporosinus sp.]